MVGQIETLHAMLATRPLLVNETFFSIQGEGSLIGAPAFFIRLDGCPLRCHWCDTAYALAGDAGRALPVESLVSMAAAHERVVITGGEPLAQDIAPLVEALAPDHHVTVETSGTIFRDLPGVALFSLSPKVGSSGYRPKPLVLRKFCASAAGRMQLKFVIAGRRDLNEALGCCDSIAAVLPADTPVVLQPESSSAGSATSYHAFLKDVVQHVLDEPAWRAYDVRVLPQLHYLLWGGQAGR
jgi:7-carboxy-7-deazaguanine synthase